MYGQDDHEERTFLDKVLRLQNGLIGCATGGGFDGGDDVYRRLRHELLDRRDVAGKLPDFVRRNRDLNQFWQFIKYEYSTYAERRSFIWNSFHAVIEYLEANDRNPSVQSITKTLERFDPDTVHAS